MGGAGKECGEELYGEDEGGVGGRGGVGPVGGVFGRVEERTVKGCRESQGQCELIQSCVSFVGPTLHQSFPLERQRSGWSGLVKGPVNSFTPSPPGCSG